MRFSYKLHKSRILTNSLSNYQKTNLFIELLLYFVLKFIKVVF